MGDFILRSVVFKTVLLTVSIYAFLPINMSRTETVRGRSSLGAMRRLNHLCCNWTIPSLPYPRRKYRISMQSCQNDYLWFFDNGRIA